MAEIGLVDREAGNLEFGIVSKVEIGDLGKFTSAKDYDLLFQLIARHALGIIRAVTLCKMQAAASRGQQLLEYSPDLR